MQRMSRSGVPSILDNGIRSPRAISGAFAASGAALFLLVGAACGGDDGATAQETNAGETIVASPASEELRREVDELQTLVDENLAKIEATTDKQELRQVLEGFARSLIDAAARLRQVDVPPPLVEKKDSLLGAIAHVEESIGGDALARLASSSVEETKEFIERFGRVAELGAAPVALEESV
jgi:hypothetical protein